MKAIIKKLDAALALRDVTQVDLERAAGLATNRVSKWKEGVGEPTAPQALAIARHLNVDLFWLADDADTGPPRPPETLAVAPDERTVLEAYWEVRGRVSPGAVAAAIGGAGKQRTPLPFEKDLKPGAEINGKITRPVTAPAKRPPRSKD